MTFGQIRLMLSTLSFAVFGTMYFPGFGGMPSFDWGAPPKSILASKCERLWVDDARNDPALECYLTSQPDRLCRTSEKDHLLWFINRYEKGKSAYEAKLFGYLIGVQTGMWKPGKTDAKGQSEDTLKKYTRVAQEQALKLKQDEAFVKATKMRTLIDPDLTALLRKLAAKGYVSEDDFGWRAPYWIADAFDKDLKVKPACKPAA